MGVSPPVVVTVAGQPAPIGDELRELLLAQLDRLSDYLEHTRSPSRSRVVEDLQLIEKELAGPSTG